jgi:hypothetical protein
VLPADGKKLCLVQRRLDLLGVFYWESDRSDLMCRLRMRHLLHTLTFLIDYASKSFA